MLRKQKWPLSLIIRMPFGLGPNRCFMVLLVVVGCSLALAMERALRHHNSRQRAIGGGEIICYRELDNGDVSSRQRHVASITRILFPCAGLN